MNFIRMMSEDVNVPEMRLERDRSWSRPIKQKKARLTRAQKKEQKLEIIFREMETQKHQWILLPRGKVNPA